MGITSPNVCTQQSTSHVTRPGYMRETSIYSLHFYYKRIIIPEYMRMC